MNYAPVAPTLATIALSACFHSSAALRPAHRINYWEALAELHPGEAVEAAHTESEKAFAESLRNLMKGDMDKAEQGFGQLRLTANDSIIRRGSRVIYTATLQYQEKWDALAALRNEPSEPKADRIDRASIELWATAFKNVPPKTLDFRSQSTLLPMSVSAVGTPLIPVRIKGKVYNFWLDTGSSMTMLASDVAQDLNIASLVPDTLEIVTSTGRVPARPSLIPELQIGQLVVRNAPTMIVDESMMRMREPTPVEQIPRFKIDGIIGFVSSISKWITVNPRSNSGILQLRGTVRIATCSGSAFRWCESLPPTESSSISDSIPEPSSRS